MACNHTNVLMVNARPPPHVSRLTWRGRQEKKKPRQQNTETRSKCNETFVSGCNAANTQTLATTADSNVRPDQLTWTRNSEPVWSAGHISAHRRKTTRHIEQVTARYERLVGMTSRLQRAHSAGKESHLLALLKQHLTELHIKNATSSVGKRQRHPTVNHVEELHHAHQA